MGESCTERFAAQIAGIAGEGRSHLTRDVPVADAGFGIGEAQRTAGAGRSERTLISERPSRVSAEPTRPRGDRGRRSRSFPLAHRRRTSPLGARAIVER